MVTPGATTKLAKEPRGALSKLIVETFPRAAAAVSKDAAAAELVGCALVVVAMMSSPLNVTTEADALAAEEATRANMPMWRLNAKANCIATPFAQTKYHFQGESYHDHNSRNSLVDLAECLTAT
jgi:hypothetical protein